jgi:Transposase DDE domain
VCQDGGDDQKVQSAKDDDPGNPSVDFRGEQRRNDTHRSTTDPDSVLYRKAKGKEARLCFGAHLLMENRHGLCADFTVHNPIQQSEPVVALQQLADHESIHEGTRPTTVGADKAYHQKAFVAACRERGIAPHVACKDKTRVAGLDGRTTRQASYRISQRIRKRVEEIIGWIKTVGGLRRSRYRGTERTQAWGYFVAGTYNLLRLARLELAASG